MTIREIIQQVALEVMEDCYAVIGTVKELTQDTDTGEWTCRVEPVDDDEADYLKIKLQAAPGSGVLMIPVIDSIVGVSLINDTQGYISVYSEIDSIQLLDGTFDGLIKINELVSRMNAMENDLNDLKSAFSNWVVSSGDGGGALKTATSSWSGSQIDITEKADIENEKITHGTN